MKKLSKNQKIAVVVTLAATFAILFLGNRIFQPIYPENEVPSVENEGSDVVFADEADISQNQIIE